MSTASNSTVQLKDSSAILPDAHVNIPLRHDIENDKIVVTPTFCGVDPLKRPAQICSVVQGKVS